MNAQKKKRNSGFRNPQSTFCSRRRLPPAGQSTYGGLPHRCRVKTVSPLVWDIQGMLRLIAIGTILVVIIGLFWIR